MNYDKIILELMSRVQVLEEQIKEVKAELKFNKNDSIDKDEFDEESNDEGEFTRSQARDKAIAIIQAKFPDHIVERATRREGSGIKITKPDENAKKAVIIKFYHSKTYNHREGFEHAWHTVNLDEIMGTIYDYCLFSVADKSGNWNFFLFEPQELGLHRDDNRSTNSELLHLYFVVKGNTATEIREGTVDVTNHLNNWNLLN